MKSKVLFRWAAWLLILAIAVFTLAPIGLRPVSGAPVNLERFAAFAIIGALFCLGYPRHRLLILVLLIGIVASLEVAQNFISGRHGRLPDAVAKALGALSGTALASIVFRQRWVRRRRPLHATQRLARD
jgi:hypothetical protein